ncbi:hypothetical protein BH11BAC6_BH11BAC6_05650 [soil metagenome]
MEKQKENMQFNIEYAFAYGMEHTDTTAMKLFINEVWGNYIKEFNIAGGKIIARTLGNGLYNYDLVVNDVQLKAAMLKRFDECRRDAMKKYFKGNN